MASRLAPSLLRIYLLVRAGIAIIATSLAAENKEVAVGPPFAWVEETPVATAGETPATSVGRHYLLVETQTNVAEKSTYHRNAYRLLNEAGLRHGSQITLSFDPSYEKLTIHHLRLIRGGQQIDRLDQSKIRVLQQERDLDYLLYNGELSALIILDDVRVGDVVDLAYTKSGANPVFGEHSVDALTLGWGDPVDFLRHRILHPEDRKIFYRIVGGSMVTPREQTSSVGRELLWEARNLPAIVFDNNLPGWYEAYSYVQLTDFPSWRTVVDWALPLYLNPPEQPLAIREKAATWTGAKPTDRALLALRFVQDEIRYLGIEVGPGSHHPSPPADVLARRFGDCKDKARLLVSLLSEMGIEAAPVLVHSSRGRTLGNWLPSPYAFDHVIVQITIDGVDYVVDPTLSYQRGAELRQRHTARYHTGLVVAKNTSDLRTWSSTPNDLRQTRVEERFTVGGFESETTLHVRTTFAARAAESMRSSLAGTNREELSKSYLDFYARYYPEITTAQPLSWKDDEAANTITVEEHYTINKIFVRQADGKNLHAEFHPTALNDYIASVGALGRAAPLALAHPVDVTSHTYIRLHEPWSITAETTEIADFGFRFNRQIKGKDRDIELIYRWRSQADHVAAENFTTHSRNLAKVNDSVGYWLTYNEAIAGVTAYTVNWAMVSLAAFTALGGARGAWLVWRRRSVEPPLLTQSPFSLPARLNGLGGWLLLVALGVSLRPFYSLHAVVSSIDVYFNADTWHAMTSRDSPSFQPAYSVIAPVEMVFAFLFLFFSVLLVALFFGRRRMFPSTMITCLALEIVASVFQAWAHVAMTTATPEERIQAYGDVARTLLVAGIWIPYFCMSRRVKATFVR